MSPYLSVRSTSSTSDFRRCEVQAAQFRAQQLRLRLQACRSGVKNTEAASKKQGDVSRASRPGSGRRRFRRAQEDPGDGEENMY